MILRARGVRLEHSATLGLVARERGQYAHLEEGLRVDLHHLRRLRATFLFR